MLPASKVSSSGNGPTCVRGSQVCELKSKYEEEQAIDRAVKLHYNGTYANLTWRRLSAGLNPLRSSQNGYDKPKLKSPIMDNVSLCVLEL